MKDNGFYTYTHVMKLVLKNNNSFSRKIDKAWNFNHTTSIIIVDKICLYILSVYLYYISINNKKTTCRHLHVKSVDRTGFALLYYIFEAYCSFFQQLLTIMNSTTERVTEGSQSGRHTNKSKWKINCYVRIPYMVWKYSVNKWST